MNLVFVDREKNIKNAVERYKKVMKEIKIIDNITSATIEIIIFFP